MTVKKVGILIFILVCLLEVHGSGYGGGHSYMVPGGSRGRKWQIRARGKGMQNMMKMPSYKKEKEEKKEVVYYPVPVYVKPKKYYEEEYEKKGYEKKGYESKTQMKIIPIYGYGDGKEYDEYRGYKNNGYGKGYDDYGGYKKYGGYEKYAEYDKDEGYGGYDDYEKSEK